MLIALVVISGVAVALAVMLVSKSRVVATYEHRYKGLIDVDGAVAKAQRELSELALRLTALEGDFNKQTTKLDEDYKAKRDLYERLLREIAILEEDLENISYGLYKPHFTYSSSDAFKAQLTAIVDKQKELVRGGGATFCPTAWSVEGSKAKGAKMTKDNAKLMLRAFNGECDAAIARVSWSNIGNMEARIQKAYEAANKLGASNHITITAPYLQLKLDELHLEFDLAQKLQEEKEEQRAIREQMREEEKALKELERAHLDAEAEEVRYQKALDKAKADVAEATGAKLEALHERIQQLESSLLKAQEQKQRAISQAQLTKSGHVYIISNIGSFGDNVYKIGMTRRLEPLDRVRELGDASVPFDFDVHGLIYSEDAPSLENTLHRKLDHTRVNMVDRRAEFFETTIEDIQRIIGDFKLKVELTKLAEARQYRETIALKKARAEAVEGTTVPELTQVEIQMSQFPASLS